MNYPIHLTELPDEYDNPDRYQEHDIQHIVSGDLHARSWNDLQATWREYVIEKTVESHYKIPVEKPREAEPIRYTHKPVSLQVRRLARILVANGMTQDDAIIQARKMLKEPAE